MVVFEDGRIIEKGNYLDLLYKSTSALRKIIEEAKGSNFSIKDCIKENVISNFKASRRTSQFHSIGSRRFGFKNNLKNHLTCQKSSFVAVHIAEEKEEFDQDISEIALFGESEEGSIKRKSSTNPAIDSVTEIPEKILESEELEEKDQEIKDTTLEKIIEPESEHQESANHLTSINKVRIMTRLSYKSIMKTSGTVVEEESLNFKEAMANLKKFLLLRGKLPIIAVILLFVISTLFTVSYDLWIGFWSNKTFGDIGDSSYFYSYIALGVIGTIYLTARDIIYDCVLKSSSGLINNLVLKKVFRFPMSWFDRQPLKRVMYRLTKDQSELDVLIPKIVLGLIESTFMLLAGIIMVSWLFIALVPIAAVILIFVISRMLKRYLRVTLKISHYISISRSEVVASCVEIMNVAVYLRNCRTLNYIVDEFMELNDEFQRNMTNVGNFSQRWIGIRLTCISSMLVFISFCYPIFFSNFEGFLAVGSFEIGLGITWSLKTIKHLKKFIVSNSLVFTKMISISRLYEYLRMEINLEADHKEKSETEEAVSRLKTRETQRNKIVPYPKSPTSNNPRFAPEHQGQNSAREYRRDDEDQNKSLSLRKVSMQTEGSRQILFDISMELKADEVIGLYGRTMSGITQLLEVIIGLYERQRDRFNLESSIEMSGISIDLMNRRTWRSHFMYLEEEPMIMSGTVKDNIDPYNKFEDDLIIKTLDFLKFNELIHPTDKLREKDKSDAGMTPRELRSSFTKKHGFKNRRLSKIVEEEEPPYLKNKSNVRQF